MVSAKTEGLFLPRSSKQISIKLASYVAIFTFTSLEEYCNQLRLYRNAIEVKPNL